MTDTYPLVYVEWRDAEHDGAWSDPRDEADHTAVLCISIGWLVHANKERIVLSATICQDNDQVANKQYIPLGMIKRYATLKKTGKKGLCKWRKGETYISRGRLKG